MVEWWAQGAGVAPRVPHEPGGHLCSLHRYHRRPRRGAARFMPSAIGSWMRLILILFSRQPLEGGNRIVIGRWSRVRSRVVFDIDGVLI